MHLTGHKKGHNQQNMPQARKWIGTPGHWKETQVGATATNLRGHKLAE